MSSVKNISVLLAAAVLAFGGCKEDIIEPVRTPVVDVTNNTLEPNADGSGTVRAYVGTHVTAVGFNLDNVGRVQVADIDAAIVEQNISSIVFEIPDLPEDSFPQQDDPYSVSLRMYDSDGETVVFNYEYYVTIPVTDAIFEDFTPSEGTVGDVLTITGRNLDQITSVTFNGVEVRSDQFVKDDSAESDGSSIQVPVPAIASEGASTPVTITAQWGGGEVLNITSDEKTFTLLTPVFDQYTQSGTAILGDEITFTGVNLDLVNGFSWGEYSLLIMEPEEGEAEPDGTSVTVKIPTSIEQMDPVVQTAALTALYGSPAQPLTVASEFRLDTTPQGAAAPEFSSVAPTDENYDKIYLDREVTVKGMNMASVEAFIIDGIEVPVSETPNDIEAKFVVPSTISGTALREGLTLEAKYDGGNLTEGFATVDVYPFYFQKGLRLGVGAGSKTSEIGNSNAFLMFNDRKTISVDEFVESNVDPFFLSGKNTVTAAANKVSGSREEYYSVAPYTILTASSSGKLAFQNPTNSSSQIKNFRYNGEALPSTYGTPMVYFRVVKDNAELKASAVDGTLSDIVYDKNCGSSAPAFGTAEGDTWVKGSVIAVSYVKYDQATAGKPDELTDVNRCGYIVIREITAGDAATGSAVEDRSGYVEFDLYWSNVINE